MPIITGVVVPPEEQPPPVALPGVGFASAVYIDPAGGVWPLTDASDDRGFFLLADGVSGLGATPYDLTLDAHPRGGARLRHAQPVERDIILPLYVFGETHQEFWGRWTALARAFTRTLRDGPGVLEIARPDGQRRRIEVRYRDGYEGSGEQGMGIISDRAVIILVAEDPYWTDIESQMVHREHSAGSSFFAPFPTISSGQVLGATTVTNPGDIEVWPEWLITGPASSVTFTHGDTGEAFTLNPSAASIAHGNLLAGEQVTVRTHPMQVRYQNGDNWTGALNWPAAALWALRPGLNAVTFQLDGSGPGSAVDLSFRARYETA